MGTEFRRRMAAGRRAGATGDGGEVPLSINGQVPNLAARAPPVASVLRKINGLGFAKLLLHSTSPIQEGNRCFLALTNSRVAVTNVSG